VSSASASLPRDETGRKRQCVTQKLCNPQLSFKLFCILQCNLHKVGDPIREGQFLHLFQKNIATLQLRVVQRRIVATGAKDATARRMSEHDSRR